MSRVCGKKIVGGPTEIGYVVSDLAIAGPEGLFQVDSYEQAQIDLGLAFEKGKKAAIDAPNMVASRAREWKAQFAKDRDSGQLAPLQKTTLVLNVSVDASDATARVFVALGETCCIQTKYVDAVERMGLSFVARFKPVGYVAPPTQALDLGVYIVKESPGTRELVGCVMQVTSSGLKNFVSALRASGAPPRPADLLQEQSASPAQATTEEQAPQS